jgi:hypothetical protein
MKPKTKIIVIFRSGRDRESEELYCIVYSKRGRPRETNRAAEDLPEIPEEVVSFVDFCLTFQQQSVFLISEIENFGKCCLTFL